MPEQENIEELRAKLRELERKQSSWATVKDIATIITPVVLLVGGFLFQRATAQDSAKLTQALEKRKGDQEQLLETIRDSRQEAGQKIEQSKLLTSLMESMLSKQPSERQLAINIALHACGEAGRQVVAAVSLEDTYAFKQLNTTRQSLVEQLVDPDASKRWQAAHELGTTWASDPELPIDLLRFAESHARTPRALYNTLVVFADLPSTAYIGKGEAVRAALRLAETAGPKGAKTEALLRTVRTKLAAAEAR